MADLPSARLHIFSPPFFSTCIDCFGLIIAKIGRWNEKCWGLIFKCLRTCAVHLDLLNSMDTDAFLLALQRFIARRGKPAEIISDRGTNFQEADRELQTVYEELETQLQQHLANYQIEFKFSPPNAPHFGGAWEWEIRSIKSALQVAMRTFVRGCAPHHLSWSGRYHQFQASWIRFSWRCWSRTYNSKYASHGVARCFFATGRLCSWNRRWRHCQNIIDQIWIRYLWDYLPTLQSRYNWQQPRDSLALWTVVVIIDPNLHHEPIGL